MSAQERPHNNQKHPGREVLRFIRANYAMDKETGAIFTRSRSSQSRVGGKLYASGDGETFEVYDEATRQNKIRLASKESNLGKVLAAEARKFGNNPAWSTVLTLRFLLPGLRSVMGVWSFSTKAEASSIPAIISAYDMVKEKAGTVVGIPFDLIVEMAKSQKPGQSSKFPVVKLVANLGAEHLENVRELHKLGMLQRTVLTPQVIEAAKAKELAAPKAEP